MNITTGLTEGILVPYSTKADDIIAIILLGCFLLSSYILGRSGKLIWQEGKDFILHKERTNLFVLSTGTDVRNRLLLSFQACVLTGIYLVSYFVLDNPVLFENIPSYVILGIYISFSILYVFLKWFFYSLLGWVFLDKSCTGLWLESYSTLLHYLSLVLFPIILFAVYFSVSINFIIIAGLLLLIITKILQFYKCLKLFLNKTDGLLLIILYFCALEIIPYFVCYKVLVQINNLLLIKL